MVDRAKRLQVAFAFDVFLEVSVVSDVQPVVFVELRKVHAALKAKLDLGVMEFNRTGVDAPAERASHQVKLPKPELRSIEQRVMGIARPRLVGWDVLDQVD